MTTQPQTLGDPEPFPLSIKPMLATLAADPFSDPKWVFEPKLDGFRILAFTQKGEVSLRTRNGNDYTGHYPSVAQDLAACPYTLGSNTIHGQPRHGSREYTPFTFFRGLAPR